MGRDKEGWGNLFTGAFIITRHCSLARQDRDTYFIAVPSGAPASLPAPNFLIIPAALLPRPAADTALECIRSLQRQDAQLPGVMGAMDPVISEYVLDDSLMRRAFGNRGSSGA